MCHAERTEVDAWIRANGGRVDDARAIRRKVVAARGEHELEGELAALAELPEPGERVAGVRALLESHPGDARLLFELASALHRAGEEAAAISTYTEALDRGLREPYRHRAQLQLASSLRVVDRPEEALRVLDDVLEARPSHTAATTLRALVQADLGRERQAVADLVRVVLEGTTDPETQSYRQALLRYAAQLAPAEGAVPGS
jgi:cyanophycin synthetase